MMIKNGLIIRRVTEVLQMLEAHGHEAYLVGGSVRDLALGRTPKDWDVATSATPSEVYNALCDKFTIVPTGVEFGTQTILVDIGDLEAIPVDVTTYRRDGNYSDGRRPDRVEFSKDIMEDLQRRDFTINAIAYSPIRGFRSVDSSLSDFQNRIIDTVGNPYDRFREDALRMMRAIRFVSQLGFNVDIRVYEAIESKASMLANVSEERIRDEFWKILVSPYVYNGLSMLANAGLMQYICPEAVHMFNFPQNKHHKYDVWEHTLHVVRNTPPVLELRLAAFFHDIGKPHTHDDGHFIWHEEYGAEIAKKEMKRLKFSNDIINSVVHMVRHHMFPVYDADRMTPAAFRRFEKRVGKDKVWDLLTLKRADIIGTGKLTAEDVNHIVMNFAQKMREATTEVEKSHKYSVLAVDGHDVMETLNIKPGQMVGNILSQLEEMVLEDPTLNTREYLIEKIQTLGKGH